jgi:hypothetical protein
METTCVWRVSVHRPRVFAFPCFPPHCYPPAPRSRVPTKGSARLDLLDPVSAALPGYRTSCRNKRSPVTARSRSASVTLTR